MRRQLIGGVAVTVVCVALAMRFKDSPVSPVVQPPLLSWSDLIPADQRKVRRVSVSGGVVTHEQGLLMAANVADAPAALREDLNGKDVRIAGYLVPIGLNGVRVTEFLVAPYLGACIHVPPPPANQMVFTHFKAGVEVSARLLTDAIVITGTLRTAAIDADLGELGSTAVGYELDAAHVAFVEE